MVYLPSIERLFHWHLRLVKGYTEGENVRNPSKVAHTLYGYPLALFTDRSPSLTISTEKKKIMSG